MQTASEIAAIATAWLIRLEREATPELWEELQTWLDSHPRHRAEFIRQRTAWNRCDKLKILRPEDGSIDVDLLTKIEFVDDDDEHEANVASESKPKSRGRDGRGLLGGLHLTRRAWLGAAVVVALGIFGAWSVALQSGWETYKTAVGASQQIALSDGSTVNLNTDSVMRVRMSAGRRQIDLQRGEALFHVAHDATRPFFVTAADTLVRAVGTEFSVRIYEDKRVDVLVAEGRVAVGTPKIDSVEQPELPPSADALSMGDVAAVSHGRLSIKHIQPDEVGRKLAWRTGYLWFQGETLGEEVAEFNRYNLRHLTVADPSILEFRYGGRFRLHDIDSFVQTLEQAFDVTAIRTPDGSEVRLIAAPNTHDGDTMPPLEEPAGVSSGHALQRAEDR
jgi:transmembrane sensor